MKWQKKHDIILSWIDSCKTFDQLTNMVHFVKRQTFERESLINFCSMKGHELHANLIVDAIRKLVK